MIPQPTTKPVRIPSLRSWEKNTNDYQLFRAGLGYLHIKLTTTGYELTQRRDLDGVNVGPATLVGIAPTAAELVEVARQCVLQPAN